MYIYFVFLWSILTSALCYFIILFLPQTGVSKVYCLGGHLILVRNWDSFKNVFIETIIAIFNLTYLSVCNCGHKQFRTILFNGFSKLKFIFTFNCKSYYLVHSSLHIKFNHFINGTSTSKNSAIQTFFKLCTQINPLKSGGSTQLVVLWWLLLVVQPNWFLAQHWICLVFKGNITSFWFHLFFLNTHVFWT